MVTVAKVTSKQRHLNQVVIGGYVEEWTGEGGGGGGEGGREPGDMEGGGVEVGGVSLDTLRVQGPHRQRIICVCVCVWGGGGGGGGGGG